MGSDPGWVTGQIPTAEQWNSAYGAKRDDLQPVFVTPVDGDRLTAAAYQGAFVIDAVSPVDSLVVVAPPLPALDGQIFEVTTTVDLTNLIVVAAGGQALRGGGPFTLAQDGGAAWRWRAETATWYRRY